LVVWGEPHETSVWHAANPTPLRVPRTPRSCLRDAPHAAAYATHPTPLRTRRTPHRRVRGEPYAAAYATNPTLLRVPRTPRRCACRAPHAAACAANPTPLRARRTTRRCVCGEPHAAACAACGELWRAPYDRLVSRSVGSVIVGIAGTPWLRRTVERMRWSVFAVCQTSYLIAVSANAERPCGPPSTASHTTNSDTCVPPVLRAYARQGIGRSGALTRFMRALMR
jgi:hypothetical protein